MKNRSIPEIGIDTRLLFQRLQNANVGEVISYKELSDIIRRDVQKEARNNLISAIRSALSEGMVFSCVRGIGIKLLEDKDLSGIGDNARKHIARTAKRAMHKMTNLRNFDALLNNEKLSHNTNLSFLGAIYHAASPRGIKALEAVVKNSMQVLPVQGTLEVFARGNKNDRASDATN